MSNPITMLSKTHAPKDARTAARARRTYTRTVLTNPVRRPSLESDFRARYERAKILQPQLRQSQVTRDLQTLRHGGEIEEESVWKRRSTETSDTPSLEEYSDAVELSAAQQRTQEFIAHIDHDKEPQSPVRRVLLGVQAE